MNIDVQQILTQMVGFLILLWLMRRFAWTPLLGLLDERRERIARSFSDIEKEKEALAALKEEYRTKMLEVEQQARLKLQEAVREGERVGREIIEAAKQEADKRFSQAQAQIQQETEAAQLRLRDEVVSLALGSAERIIRQELNQPRDTALVLQYLEEVKSREK